MNHNGRRVLRRVEPRVALGRVLTKVRALQEEIHTLLDEIVEIDRKQCGSTIPSAVIRGLRLNPYCHRPCMCAWLKDEFERAGGES